MKILLVKPHSLSDHIQAPLGLGYLASALRPGHNVRILDCLKEGITSPRELVEALISFQPDILGLQCYTFHRRFINDVLKEVKKLNKNIICVVGGPHPSVQPEETLGYFGDCLDFGFAGEAEVGFRRLVEALSCGEKDFSSIPGLIFRDKGAVKVNPAEFVDDLDSLGLPSWDLMRPETYPEAQHGAFYRKFPIAPIIATRGCPYPCTFCAGNKIAGRRIRKHSVKYILGQIMMLYADFGIREFHIVDDNFTFEIDYAKELLRGIIALKLDISWATPNGVRLDRLDDELLSLMKKSGLYLISLGIESGSDRVLKLMKKGTTVSRIESAVKLIREHGLEIAGFFILGYPGETKEEIEETIRFSRRLGLIRANFFTFLPFPGTESFKMLEENGELANVDWDNFYFASAPYVSRELSREDLKRLQRKAFLRFYFRPGIFFRNIAQIKSWRHFGFLLKRFYHWIVRG